MGEQYRYRLIGDMLFRMLRWGDNYGGYWNNEMKTRNISENEMKILNEIPMRLPSLRAILKDIGRQFNSRYTIGDYLEEHGYEVAKNGKYVWFIKRR